MKRLRELSLSNLLTIALSIGAIGVGLALGYTDGWTRIAGGLLATGGGIVVSAVVTAEYAKVTSRSDINRQLETLGRHLSTASGQVSQAVSAAQTGAIDPITGLALVSQSTRTLFTIINDIQTMTGDRFDPSDVVDMYQRLEEFATHLATASKQVDESAGASLPSADTQEIETVRAQLSSTLQQLKKGERVTTIEILPCPDCSSSVPVTIGAWPGDSAMPTCGVCGSRFHAHRDGFGRLFTRKWGVGQGPDVSQMAVQCPECEYRISIRVDEDDEELRVRYCLNCFARLDVVKGEVVKASKEEPLEGTIVGDDGGKSLIKCPLCERRVKSFVKRAGVCFGVCPVDYRLIRARDDGQQTPAARPDTADHT